MSMDSMRGNSGYDMGNRRPGAGKYPDKPNYSPSTSYLSHGSGQFSGQQPRRRPENFKKPPVNNFSERIVKQNDIIIRLLKEIRDRLPENPNRQNEPVAQVIAEELAIEPAQAEMTVDENEAAEESSEQAAEQADEQGDDQTDERMMAEQPAPEA